MLDDGVAEALSWDRRGCPASKCRGRTGVGGQRELVSRARFADLLHCPAFCMCHGAIWTTPSLLGWVGVQAGQQTRRGLGPSMNTWLAGRAIKGHHPARNISYCSTKRRSDSPRVHPY